MYSGSQISGLGISRQTRYTGHKKSGYRVSGKQSKLSGYRLSGHRVSRYQIISNTCFKIRTKICPDRWFMEFDASVSGCPETKVPLYYDKRIINTLKSHLVTYASDTFYSAHYLYISRCEIFLSIWSLTNERLPKNWFHCNLSTTVFT